MVAFALITGNFGHCVSAQMGMQFHLDGMGGATKTKIALSVLLFGCFFKNCYLRDYAIYNFTLNCNKRNYILIGKYFSFKAVVTVASSYGA